MAETTKGIKGSRKGKELVKCNNCKCSRYGECGCKKKKEQEQPQEENKQAA